MPSHTKSLNVVELRRSDFNGAIELQASVGSFRETDERAADDRPELHPFSSLSPLSGPRVHAHSAPPVHLSFTQLVRDGQRNTKYADYHENGTSDA